MKIVDYEDKYADKIDDLEEMVWDVSGAKSEYENGNIFKICVNEKEDVLGCLYGKLYGDMFHMDVIVIHPDYQKQGIGTALNNAMLSDSRLSNVKNIIITAVYNNGKMNAKGLVKNMEFEEIMRIKGYWADNKPEITCKVCNSKPCECTCVIFKKELVRKR